MRAGYLRDILKRFNAMLTCKKIKQCFDDALDDILPEMMQQDFQEHLKQCAYCGKDFQYYSKAVSELRAASSFEPESRVFTRIMATLNTQTTYARSEKLAVPFFIVRKISYAAVFCAAIFLVVMAGKTLHQTKMEKENQIAAFLVQQHETKWLYASADISLSGYDELLGVNSNGIDEKPSWENVFAALGI